MKDPRNILVTGGSGHIGLNLLKEVIKKYENVYVLVRKNDKLNSLTDKIIECDITDSDCLLKHKEVFEKIDVVIHLAAFVPKPGKDDEEQATKVNVDGTMNIAKLMKKGSRFVFISTCEVYGVPKTDMIKEDHPLESLSNYGKSKVVAENSLKEYAKDRMELVILRLTNVYGPGEVMIRAIPNFIKAVAKGESPTIYGDGSDKRDFIYVDDAVGYIMAAIEKGSGTYNIATGKVYTIKDIAEKVIKIAKSGVDIKFEGIKKPRMDYIFDISRAKELDYVPKVDIEEGLSREIDWFKNEK